MKFKLVVTVLAIFASVIFFGGCGSNDDLTNEIEDLKSQLAEMQSNNASAAPAQEFEQTAAPVSTPTPTPTPEPTPTPTPIPTPDPLKSVTISIDCTENLMFSRYDVDIFIDGEWQGKLDHGANGTISINLEKGIHTFRAQNVSDASVDGEVSFEVTESSANFWFDLYCTADQVQIS